MSAPTLQLVLTLPPSVNKMWQPVRCATGAKLIKRKPSEDWAKEARWTVASQRGGLVVPYHFRALIVLPEVDGDPDNYVKPLFDACQAGGAIVDDAYNRGFTVEIDESRMTVLVELYSLGGTAPARKARATSAGGRSFSGAR